MDFSEICMFFEKYGFSVAGPLENLHVPSCEYSFNEQSHDGLYTLQKDLESLARVLPKCNLNVEELRNLFIKLSYIPSVKSCENRDIKSSLSTLLDTCLQCLHKDYIKSKEFLKILYVHFGNLKTLIIVGVFDLWKGSRFVHFKQNLAYLMFCSFIFESPNDVDIRDIFFQSYSEENVTIK